MNMIRKPALFLLLVVMLTPAMGFGLTNAQTLFDSYLSSYCYYPFIDYTELTELTSDEFVLEGWLPDTENYVSFLKNPGLRLETRHNFIPDRDYLTNRFLITPERKTTGFVPQAYVVYYQKLRKAYYPENLGQAGLFFNTKGLIRQVVLGNFSLNAGEGLTLGCSKARGWGRDLINPAFTLSHPVMSGAAIQLKYHKLEGVVWLSQTERLATMDGGKILNLYESLISDLKDKDKIQEKTNGIITTYNNGNCMLGMHYYQQNYSKQFADSTVSPVSDVYGLWGTLHHQKFSLQAETNLVNDKLAFTGYLHLNQSNRYKSPSYIQTIRYIYRPDTCPLSFSRTHQIFGQKTAAQEISWDFQYSITKHLILMSRIAAFKELNDEVETSWKERMILSAIWKEDVYQNGLTWYRFRRDAVAAYDSLGTEILPTQNRFRANWEKEINFTFRFSSVIQYQHYLDQSISKNGFSLKQAVQIRVLPLIMKLSFLAWANQKSSYQPSEDQADEELLIQAGSDSALRLQADYRFNSAFELGLGSYFPFKNTAYRSFSLNLKTAF